MREKIFRSDNILAGQTPYRLPSRGGSRLICSPSPIFQGNDLPRQRLHHRSQVAQRPRRATTAPGEADARRDPRFSWHMDPKQGEAESRTRCGEQQRGKGAGRLASRDHAPTADLKNVTPRAGTPIPHRKAAGTPRSKPGKACDADHTPMAERCGAQFERDNGGTARTKRRQGPPVPPGLRPPPRVARDPAASDPADRQHTRTLS
jgi:hypothetical protein